MTLEIEKPVLAYFEFSSSALGSNPSQVVRAAAALAQLNLKIDPAQLSEKTGYRFEGE